MLRKEANSGQMHDLAHVRSACCLADALTKASAKPDQLIKSINSGILERVDEHPPFRMLLQHIAFMIAWLKKIVSVLYQLTHGFGFFGETLNPEETHLPGHYGLINAIAPCSA